MSRYLHSLLILICMASPLANAGSFACSPQDVTIPCMTSGWSVHFEWDYIAPSNDDLEFLREDFGPPPHPQHGVIPGERSGFDLGINYFYDKGRDLALNWFHFNRVYDGNFRRVASPDLILDAAAKFDIDAVNLELGQLFEVGERSQLRVFFGAHLVNIANHAMTLYESQQQASSGGAKSISTFDGVGPVFGVNWDHHLKTPHQLHFIARVATALLVGDLSTEVKSKQTFESPEWEPFIAKAKRRVIVPHIDIRLALRLPQLMAFSSGHVAVEGGWRFFGYFQAVHFTEDSRGLRASQFISNFTGQGPFVRFTFHGK